MSFTSLLKHLKLLKVLKTAVDLENSCSAYSQLINFAIVAGTDDPIFGLKPSAGGDSWGNFLKFSSSPLHFMHFGGNKNPLLFLFLKKGALSGPPYCTLNLKPKQKSPNP